MHELDLFTKFHSFTPGLLQKIFILPDLGNKLLFHFVEFYVDGVNEAF